jgi:RloB-like protein
MRGRIRTQRKTLLAIGEGDTEVAFLKHVRSLYCSDRFGVNMIIKNANGRGPDNVINHAVRSSKQASYDRQLCLLDTDIKWSDKIVKVAKIHRISLIGSTPCIEGLLLLIFGEKVPDQSANCKKTLQQLTKNDMSEVNHYKTHFPKQHLDTVRQEISVLNELLMMIEGSALSLKKTK